LSRITLSARSEDRSWSGSFSSGLAYRRRLIGGGSSDCPESSCSCDAKQPHQAAAATLNTSRPLSRACSQLFSDRQQQFLHSAVHPSFLSINLILCTHSLPLSQLVKLIHTPPSGRHPELLALCTKTMPLTHFPWSNFRLPEDQCPNSLETMPNIVPDLPEQFCWSNCLLVSTLA
jgi:hypothetical protein